MRYEARKIETETDRQTDRERERERERERRHIVTQEKEERATQRETSEIAETIRGKRRDEM